MNNRPTPETAAFAVKFKTLCGEKYWVPVDIASKLERERDEAREVLEHWKSEWEIVEARLCGWKHPRDNGIIFEHEVIPVLRKERDEAREKLDEEMKFHHRTHTELVQTQCQMQDVIRERDEAREALMRIEDLFLDGTDIYADRENMGLIAREALEGTK